MVQDIGWKGYFADNDRYADIINGIGCGGRQVIAGNDLHELDTQVGFLRGAQLIKRWSYNRGNSKKGSYKNENPKKESRKIKIRDTLRKAAFGVNFAIIGIENQESIDYSMPLRNMSYDVGEYEKQAAKIRREVRKRPKGLSRGEYLYGFLKESRMHPVVTFILYSGVEEWDGPESLHEMINFEDIPEKIIGMVPNYQINLVEIRKLTDTNVFKTDVRQVFDFIRCSENKKELKTLVEGDKYYSRMEEDAYDIVVHYTNAAELIEAKDYYSGKDGKVDMCKAIKELIEDGREEGRVEGRIKGIAEGREEGREEGIAEGREEGLRALVFSLSLLLPDSNAVYQAIIKNEGYRNVSKEQVMRYYKQRYRYANRKTDA